MSVLACKAPPASRSPAAETTPAAVVPITGSYRFAPNPADSIAGCQLQALRLPGDSLRFQLDCNRGGPSYSSGFAEGVLPLAGDSATWRTVEYGGACLLHFAFDSAGAVVRQTGHSADCGFGNGVIAAGTLRRLDTLPPAFERNR